MKTMLPTFRTLVGVCVALLALRSDGQLSRIRDYKLHQPEDRGVRFVTTVTRDHALLTLVAREDGKWLLTKVRNWWGDQPQEEKLVIAGFAKRDNLNGTSDIRLLPTPDGEHLVALVWAGLKGPNGDPFPDEMMISVVRLEPFRMESSAVSRKLGLNGYLAGFLDPSGQIVVVSSLYPSQQSESASILHTYRRLALTDLHQEAVCSYTMPLRPSPSENGKGMTALEDACGKFARQGGYSSTVEMDKVARNDTDRLAPPFPTKQNFLGWQFIVGENGGWLGMSSNSQGLAALNDDGSVIRQFEPKSMCGKQSVRGPAWICECQLLGATASNAVIECSTSHDSFLGWSVGLRHWIAEVDVENERDLPSVEIPIRDTFEAKLVDIGSEQLLLVVINGSRLEVFSVSAPS